MGGINYRKSTGCRDIAGEVILEGDAVLVKSDKTGMKAVFGVAEPRDDGTLGFRVRHEDGYISWAADDHDSCYEVVKLSA